MLLGNPFKKHKKLLARLYAKQERYEEKMDEGEDCQTELDLIIAEVDSFIENIYARAVFEHYTPKQPVLIDKRSGKAKSWNSVFSNDFSALSKNLKYALVGLVEGTGQFELG